MDNEIPFIWLLLQWYFLGFFAITFTLHFRIYTQYCLLLETFKITKNNWHK